MPRYYFDLKEGLEVIPDEEGMELSTLARVQEEAARSLADMARDTARRAHDGEAYALAIEVRDDDGPVLQAQFTFNLIHLRK